MKRFGGAYTQCLSSVKGGFLKPRHLQGGWRRSLVSPPLGTGRAAQEKKRKREAADLVMSKLAIILSWLLLAQAAVQARAAEVAAAAAAAAAEDEARNGTRGAGRRGTGAVTASSGITAATGTTAVSGDSRRGMTAGGAETSEAAPGPGDADAEGGAYSRSCGEEGGTRGAGGGGARASAAAPYSCESTSDHVHLTVSRPLGHGTGHVQHRFGHHRSRYG